MTDHAGEQVLVIGGGISGIKAAFELLKAGKRVHLVERKASIGGKLVQLHSMYPSFTSPMASLSPLMSELFENPNATIHTLADVKAMEGEPGSFRAKVLKRPRYIVEDRCTCCGKCLEVCPVDDVPDEFNLRLSRRRSIYMHFPQAVPNVPVIDRHTCKHFTDGSCNACKEACGTDAIDYDMKEVEIDLEVAAIIVTTGYDLFDCNKAPEYGYGKSSNVFTGMEYERMSHPAGPTGGRILRRSDGKEPRSVAWIQCVGSRSTQHLIYCCSVGCMNSIKAALHLDEHTGGAAATIFYKDMRCYGKGFNEIMIKAEKEKNVTFINSDATVSRKEGSDDLIVTYDEAGKPESLEFEMVVLAQGTRPIDSSAQLAKILGIDINEYGFFKSRDRISASCESSRSGVFIAGYCHEPKIISEAVSQGEAAAASVDRFLVERGGG